MPRNYVSVFKMNENDLKDVVDIGLDPDFSKPVPTWGICRPQVRTKWVEPGSKMVFVGHQNGLYFIKGIFEVGEKISYIEALRRFHNRRNVIIRNCDKKKKPHCYLKYIKCGDKIYKQNPDDDHPLKNWKCRRMFLCQKNQFDKCEKKQRCLREVEFPEIKGYIVAGRWIDVGKKRIPWNSVCPRIFRNVPLITPVNQHNVRRISDNEIDEIINNLHRRGVKANWVVFK